jgi:hypothetical protein
LKSERKVEAVQREMAVGQQKLQELEEDTNRQLQVLKNKMQQVSGRGADQRLDLSSTADKKKATYVTVSEYWSGTTGRRR